MADEARKGVGAWPIVVFTTTLLVLVSLIVRLFLGAEVPAALVIAIAAIAGLLILSPRVLELAELTISKEGLVAKLRDVEQKVETTEKKIDQLFAYTMSESMFGILGKLAKGNFGHIKITAGVRRQLRHLRIIGYITVKGPIGNLPDEVANLSDYVTVTPVGKEFVAFRESLEAKSSP
jgi:hypothetical protein